MSSSPKAKRPTHPSAAPSLPPARVRTRPSSNPQCVIPAVTTSAPPAAEDVGASGEPRNYEVGYGRPPKSTRFQRGQSGNPKGRPKGSRSMSTLIGEGLDKPMKVRSGGRVKTMLGREVLVQKMLESAFRLDRYALQMVMKLDPRGVIAAAQDAAVEQPMLSAEEETILTKLLSRYSADDENEG